MLRGRMLWLVIAAAVALLFVLIRSSMQAQKFRYEICVEFQGRTHCATASGATPDQAIRSAKEIDCSLLASGRDDNMVCLDTQPSSQRDLSAH